MYIEFNNLFRIKRYISFIIIIFFCLNFISCGKERTKITINDMGYPDLKGKHIVVYVASREEIGRTLLEMFKEKTSCTYEYIRMPTQEAVEKIYSEKKSPKADVFIGGTCDAHALMKNEKLSEKYISKNHPFILEKYKDMDGYWIGFEVNPLSIVINKDVWNRDFADKKIDMPKTYEDLLDPIYKDKIVISDPNTSGTAYTMLASIDQIKGEDESKEFFRKLKSNVGEFTVNGYTPAQKVATGEYLIGINFLADQLLIKDSGFNITTNVVQNSGWNIDALSKIRNAPNGEVGKYFIDFCTSKEVQAKLANISFGMSTRNDIKGKRGIDLDQLSIYENYDFVKASNDKKRLIDMWNSLE